MFFKEVAYYRKSGQEFYIFSNEEIQFCANEQPLVSTVNLTLPALSCGQGWNQKARIWYSTVVDIMRLR